MRNLLIAECIKLKRRKILLLLPIALIAEIVMIFSQIRQTDFFDVYLQAFLPVTLAVHSIVVCLFGISFFYDEYKNKTITYVATTPISPAKFLFSKLTVMGAFSLCLNLVTALLFVLVSFTFDNGVSLQFLFAIFVHTLSNAITFTLASIPLLLLAIIFKSNILLFFLAGFSYVGIILMHTSGMIFIGSTVGLWLLDCIHPLGNAIAMSLQIMFENTYRFAPNPEKYNMLTPGVIWPTQIAYLVGVSLICVCISIVLLKRQKDI